MSRGAGLNEYRLVRYILPRVGFNQSYSFLVPRVGLANQIRSLFHHVGSNQYCRWDSESRRKRGEDMKQGTSSMITISCRIPPLVSNNLLLTKGYKNNQLNAWHLHLDHCALSRLQREDFQEWHGQSKSKKENKLNDDTSEESAKLTEEM
jgi:hypothetical protein